MKKFVILALLVALGFGGWGVYRALQPTSEPSFAELPPAEQQKRREDAQELVAQVEAVAQSARKRENRPFVLTASEQQLNTLLQDRLRVQSMPVSDLRATLEPGELILNGTASYQGLSVPVEMRGTMEAQNGAVVYTIQSLKLSIADAPDDWRQKAQKAISDALSRAFTQGTNVQIDKVEVRDDSLTVSGRTRG